MEDRGDGTYLVAYTPTAPGPLQVNVAYLGNFLSVDRKCWSMCFGSCGEVSIQVRHKRSWSNDDLILRRCKPNTTIRNLSSPMVGWLSDDNKPYHQQCSSVHVSIMRNWTKVFVVDELINEFEWTRDISSLKFPTLTCSTWQQDILASGEKRQQQTGLAVSLKDLDWLIIF